MAPITRESAALGPPPKLVNNEPILIHSTQAAGIVRDTFVGEAGEGKGGEEEMTGG